MNILTFKNHPAFTNLSSLKARLESQEAIEKIDNFTHEFHVTASNYILAKLKTTIPILVVEAEMNALAQEIITSVGQLNLFLTNKNIGHVTNSIANLNSAMNRIQHFPNVAMKGDYDFSKVIVDFENTVNSKLENIRSENKSLKAQNAQLKRELDTTNQNIQKANNQILQKEKEIQNLNSQFQTEYNNIKTTANNNIEIDRKKFRAEFDEEKKSLRKEIESQIEEIDNTSTEILAELEGKLDDARKLVNVIGNIGATGNFQIIANYHKKEANTWRYVALGFMSILSVILIYTIWDISENEFDWLKSLIRIVAAGILSYPATYAAQESNKHRKQENYNRKIELELAAINPFIEFLEDPKKQIIKEKLVDKYFGNQLDSNGFSENHDTDIPISAFEKILKGIKELIKN